MGQPFCSTKNSRQAILPRADRLMGHSGIGHDRLHAAASSTTDEVHAGRKAITTVDHYLENPPPVTEHIVHVRVEVSDALVGRDSSR